MEKTIHISKISKLNLNRVRFNDGMEVLMINGWHKVIYNNGVNKNKDKKKVA